eukprot:1020628-Pelagomonas_calceolata.AAC.4
MHIGDWGKMEARPAKHLNEVRRNLTWLTHWGIYNNRSTEPKVSFRGWNWRRIRNLRKVPGHDAVYAPLGSCLRVEAAFTQLCIKTQSLSTLNPVADNVKLPVQGLKSSLAPSKAALACGAHSRTGELFCKGGCTWEQVNQQNGMLHSRLSIWDVVIPVITPMGRTPVFGHDKSPLHPRATVPVKDKVCAAASYGHTFKPLSACETEGNAGVVTMESSVISCVGWRSQNQPCIARIDVTLCRSSSMRDASVERARRQTPHYPGRITARTQHVTQEA